MKVEAVKRLDISYDPIKQVVKTLLTELEALPEEVRDKAYFRSDYERDYDGDYRTTLEIVWERDETPEEEKARLDCAKLWEERRIADAKKILGIK